MKDGAVPGMCLPGGSRYFEHVHVEAGSFHHADDGSVGLSEASGHAPDILSDQTNHDADSLEKNKPSPVEPTLVSKDDFSATKVKAPPCGVACSTEIFGLVALMKAGCMVTRTVSW